MWGKAVYTTVLIGISFFITSCNSSKGKTSVQSIKGNWVILYPDHKLSGKEQRKIYGKYQDSIVSLYGLKLISFSEEGEFQEMDSLQRPPARWILSQENLLKIREGGKGFNPFNTELAKLSDSLMLLTQYLTLEEEEIRVDWHLKKVEDEDVVNALYSAEANSWRNRPTSAERKEVLRKRLSDMLLYYGNYFLLIGEEAAYFSPIRVALPLRYYQHAIGMSGEMRPAFKNLFYNEEDALKAYKLLEQAISALGRVYPRDKNFVLEYGLFLKKMAEWVKPKA